MDEPYPGLAGYLASLEPVKKKQPHESAHQSRP